MQGINACNFEHLYDRHNVTFVTSVDLLLFSPFSDIPGAYRIKICDKNIKKIYVLNICEDFW